VLIQLGFIPGLAGMSVCQVCSVSSSTGACSPGWDAGGAQLWATGLQSPVFPSQKPPSWKESWERGSPRCHGLPQGTLRAFQPRVAGTRLVASCAWHGTDAAPEPGEWLSSQGCSSVLCTLQRGEGLTFSVGPTHLCMRKLQSVWAFRPN